MNSPFTPPIVRVAFWKWLNWFEVVNFTTTLSWFVTFAGVVPLSTPFIEYSPPVIFISTNTPSLKPLTSISLLLISEDGSTFSLVPRLKLLGVVSFIFGFDFVFVIK